MVRYAQNTWVAKLPSPHTPFQGPRRGGSASSPSHRPDGAASRLSAIRCFAFLLTTAWTARLPGAEGFLFDRQRLIKQRLGVGVAALP